MTLGADDEAKVADIHIEPHGMGGYVYDVKLPDYRYDGIAGFAPTRSQLAADIAELINRYMAGSRWDRDPSKSVECPHCHWGFSPAVIAQHLREKH